MTSPLIAPHRLLIHKIKALEGTLSRAQGLVASVMLDQPHALLRMSLHDFAQLAGVSEPTVVRFCRTLGFSGYRDFKIVLAQDLVASETYGDVTVDAADGVAEVIHKVFNSTLENLVRARNALQPEKIEAAVQAILAARKIEFYALGPSGDIAVDAHHKFFRLGFNCVAYTDLGMQKISARALSSRDVVLVISSSGSVRELVEVVDTAVRAGAYVIGVTAQHSALAALCTLVLNVDLNPLAEVYSPIMSRIAHLLLLDILAVAVTVQSH